MGRFLFYSLKVGARLWFQQPGQLNSEVMRICPSNGDTGLLSGLVVCLCNETYCITGRNPNLWQEKVIQQCLNIDALTGNYAERWSRNIIFQRIHKQLQASIQIQNLHSTLRVRMHYKCDRPFLPQLSLLTRSCWQSYNSRAQIIYRC